jgi:hypothetical protein
MNIFNFRLELTNPFDRWEYFKNLGSISGRLTKHKAWELEHNFYSSMMLDIDIQWNRNSDHAGIHISVGIFGYGVAFRIYDTRHWNYETKSWEEYDFTKYEVDYYA